MGKWIEKLLDRLLVVLGALAFIQFPLFIHQYELQLIGHVHELNWQVERMRSSALESGKTLEAYIQKFVLYSDQDISRQGATMEETLSRWNRFSFALAKLQHASSIERPWLFIAYVEPSILKSTLQSFKPGLSFSMESTIYAFIGMILGYLLYWSCVRIAGATLRALRTPASKERSLSKHPLLTKKRHLP